MKLDPKKPLWKNIQFRLSKYEMEAGILEDVKRKRPLFGQFKTYAGQTVLKTGRMSDEKDMSELAAELDKKYKWLRRPFYSEKNKEVVKVVSDITKDLNGQGDKRRILNGCQAIFRNPILRGDYGRNSDKWKKQKGFDKLLMMTGQFFKAIKARFVR